jgi:predicted Zn finger-like uncharacterized protein
MRIRCERCQAEYELDDAQVRGGTRIVKCSVCGNVFTARAIPTSNDDARASSGQIPAVSREAGTGSMHRSNQGGLKILVCLTVAAGVAVAGIEWQRDRVHKAAMATNAVAPSKVGRRPEVKTPDARPDLGIASAALQGPSRPATTHPAARGPLVEALPSPEPAEPEKIADKAESEAPVRAESYDKLVAEADRALEHGANSKAKELYQRALHLRSAGAQALSGMGFVALDRGQIPVAYEFFKRALAAKPSLGPAVFGMAEIHRARGEKALALNSYQHYLKLSPKGREAAAARRQISTLQSSK